MSDGLITRKPTPAMVELLRQGAADPQGRITMADHNDRTQDGLLRRDMADVVDAGPWLGYLVITDRGRAYLAKLDAAQERAEEAAASEHTRAHDAHFLNADGTFRADRSEQAYASAVNNADQTAREEGFERGTDQWHRVVLSSYASLIDDGAYTEPAQEPAQEAVSAPQAAQERPAAPVAQQEAEERQEAPEAPRKAVIRFETTECGRCMGTGRFGPASIRSGQCFNCHGDGKVLSRRGTTARERYDALVLERLGRRVWELAEGDVVWAHYSTWAGALPVDSPKAWRTVTRVEWTEADSTAARIVTYEGGERKVTPLSTGLVAFKTPEGRTERTVSVSAAREYFDTWIFPVYDRDALVAIMREVAARYTGAWMDGEEPPQRPVRRPRAVKAAPVAQERQEAAQEAPAPAPKRLAANMFPGDCHKCRARVEAQQGERLRMGGRWAVQHREGECQGAE